MLSTVLISLVFIWAMGFFMFNLGGLTHLILILALVFFVVRLLQGRKVVYRG